MALSISKLQISSGNEYYYSSGFRAVVESMVPILKKLKGTIHAPVAEQDRYHCIGDFYRLLKILKVSQDMFWITMRVNGLHSPLEYDGIGDYVLIPNKDFLATELQKFLTVTLS